MDSKDIFEYHSEENRIGKAKLIKEFGEDFVLPKKSQINNSVVAIDYCLRMRNYE